MERARAGCRVKTAACLLVVCWFLPASTSADSAESQLVRPPADSEGGAINDGVRGSVYSHVAGASASATKEVHPSQAERVAARIRRASLNEQAQYLFEQAEKYRIGSPNVIQDGQRAMSLYRQSADVRAGPGSAAAMATLARMYQTGWDGKSDILEILTPESSPQGHISGKLRRLINLSGSSYLSIGNDVNSTALTGVRLIVPPSMPTAVRLWSDAASLGNATAQFVMGVLHTHGLFGVPLDGARAVVLYTFAAMGGSHEAHLALAYRHQVGLGVQKDCPASVTHFFPPAEAAAASAESSRGLSILFPILHRDRLSDETLEALASDMHRGDTGMVAYYQNAAEKGDTAAHVALGHLYLLGAKGAQQNFALAAEHFHAAAEHNDALSLAVLGFLYLHGLGVERDVNTAAAFLKEPAEGGLAAALNTLGVMTMSGLGGAQDAVAAFAMFKKAAENSFADAAFNAGLMFATGTAPGGRDFRSAAQYFRSAASAGHIPSLVRLAKMQALGLGGPKDCAGAQNSLHSAVYRSPHTSVSLANGYRLLASGNPGGALLEYLRGAEVGLEVGAWNAAYLLEEGIVQDAVESGVRSGVDGEALEVDASSQHDKESPEAGAANDATAESSPAFESSNESRGTPQMSAEAGATPARLQTDVRTEDARPTLHSAVPGPTPPRPPSPAQQEVHYGVTPGFKETLQLWHSLVAPSKAHGASPLMLRKALRLYQRSAAQGSGPAELAIGDFHFYGRGGLNASAEAAADHFRVACGHHVAQACFNLGWMHETGTGVPADSHLAKRYYDSTLEEQKTGRPSDQSAVPVRLALWRLQARDGFTAWRDSIVRPILSLFGAGRAADFANGLLSLPPFVPRPAQRTGKKPSVKSTVDKKAQAPLQTEPAGPSIAPPTPPTPAAPSVAPTDDKARRKAALDRHKASREAKQRSSSILDGFTSAISRSLASAGLASGLGDDLSLTDSLLLLAASLAMGALTVRMMRVWVEARAMQRQRQNGR